MRLELDADAMNTLDEDAQSRLVAVGKFRDGECDIAAAPDFAEAHEVEEAETKWNKTRMVSMSEAIRIHGGTDADKAAAFAHCAKLGINPDETDTMIFVD